MRTLSITLLLVTCILSACKKATPAPDATAAFTVSEYGGFGITYTDTVFYVAKHDAFVFRNASAGFNTIQWDFGDGRTSSVADTVVSFDKPGNYNVTLTAANSDGKKSVSARLFTVYETVLKSFSIDKFQMNMFAPSQNNLPVFSKMDVWLELKESRSTTDTYAANGDITGAVTVYKSQVFTNVDSSFHGTLSASLTAKAAIDYPVKNIAYPGNTGLGFMINLYGQTSRGVYLLASSRWSGTGFGYVKYPNLPVVKEYSLEAPVAGSPTRTTINCAYQ